MRWSIKKPKLLLFVHAVNISLILTGFTLGEKRLFLGVLPLRSWKEVFLFFCFLACVKTAASLVHLSDAAGDKPNHENP